MSVKIQLLSLSELEDGKRYLTNHGELTLYGPFHVDYIRNELSSCTGYLHPDAIEFVPPDPDKGLIEGWVASLDKATPQCCLVAGDWVMSSLLKTVARSFLAYQRKQEGEK